MKVLVLRSNDKDNRSYGNFQYPMEGAVEASDWDPKPQCGSGLHGFLWGAGDGRLANWDEAAKWMVLEVETEEGFVDLGDKVKFRRGRVVLVADRKTATDYVLANRPTSEAKPVIGSIVAAGDYGTATAGEGGTATAGNGGTATAGNGGTATAGNNGTATAGYNGTATAGYNGTATAGKYGTATAGDYGTATAGDYGTATAGYDGTATAGDYGTATAGDYGTATAGYDGTATAGEGGIIQIKYWDGKRSRLAVGYIGEDNLEANVSYTLDSKGKFVKA